MKICVVSRGDIFPPNHGAAVKLYYTMTSLDSIGHDVYFVTEENDKYYHVEDGEFVEKEYPKLFHKAFHDMDLYKKIVRWLGVPEEDWILYHPMVNLNLWLRTLYVAIREDIELLQPEFPAFAFPSLFTKLLTGKKVSLVEHNVECFRVQETAEDLSDRGKKVIHFVEDFACRLSNYVLPVSQEDADRLEKLNLDYTEIVPIGVDIERFEKGDGQKIRDKYNIDDDTTLLIYHGVLNYSPNIEAAEILEEDILPELRKRGKDFKLLLVGGYPPDVDDEDIITTGFVGPLEDYIDAADMAVVPLRSGGGLTMKVLEYFSVGVPVVATEKAMEGIDAEAEKHFIKSEVGSFIENILKLDEDIERQEELSEKARSFVEKFGWENVAKMYEKVYKES
ncbi:MAG: glycosyltransferase family 4 protein [Candidatus Aenigmatarchaeota archaeon]